MTGLKYELRRWKISLMVFPGSFRLNFAVENGSTQNQNMLASGFTLTVSMNDLGSESICRVRIKLLSPSNKLCSTFQNQNLIINSYHRKLQCRKTNFNIKKKTFIRQSYQLSSQTAYSKTHWLETLLYHTYHHILDLLNHLKASLTTLQHRMAFLIDIIWNIKWCNAKMSVKQFLSSPSCLTLQMNVSYISKLF